MAWEWMPVAWEWVPAAWEWMPVAQGCLLAVVRSWGPMLLVSNWCWWVEVGRSQTASQRESWLAEGQAIPWWALPRH